MTKSLVWRLSKLPTVEELQNLVKDKIITQDEARDILFKSETTEDRDKESLMSEIKFLRELVEKLSENKLTTIVETIKYVDRPYYRDPWFAPYKVWCQAIGGNGSITLGSNETIVGSTSQNAQLLATATIGTNFKDISTF